MEVTPIYTELISKIKTTLNSVGQIKAVYAYPVTKVTTYPSAIFFPDRIENTFETGSENLKTYNFKLYIVVGATETTVANVFESTLPRAVDAVLAQFDDSWNGGSIDGHRVWSVLSSGQWTMSTEKQGLEAVAEFNLVVKLLTNN